MINALNSGASTFMADFEDASTPTWMNVVAGQRNMIDAVERTITYDSEVDERHYALHDEIATLIVRPRGWHLDERHMRVDGEVVSGALVDFGLYMFHNAKRLVDRGSGPYFYLPKLEHHTEAALWNDVFVSAQDALGLDRGTVRATVLVETLPAAFQMEEILHALREHSTGLNAGRWDYIFSTIKCFRDRPEFVTPDRHDVKMTVPFMRAYTELLVRTCHRRGAHAMGGMAALIPSRKDPEANERAIAGVREDKKREATDGFDGTWVAHPDIVAPAREEFDAVLGDRPNQIDRLREDVAVEAGRPPRRGGDAGRDHRGRAAQRHQRRVPVHLVLARRPRRGGDQQPHGGRRHGRDLALADLAVDPPRRERRGRRDDHARPRPRDPRGRDGAHPRRRRRRGVGGRAA